MCISLLLTYVNGRSSFPLVIPFRRHHPVVTADSPPIVTFRNSFTADRGIFFFSVARKWQDSTRDTMLDAEL